jgi:hypothetical protein
MLVSRPIPLPGLATAMVTTMSVIVALALIRIRLDMRTCSSVWWVWVLYRRGEWLLGRRWVDSSGRQVDSTRWLLVVVFKPVGPFPSPSFSSHSFSIQCMFHPLSSLDTVDGWCNIVTVNRVSLAPSLPPPLRNVVVSTTLSVSLYGDDYTVFFLFPLLDPIDSYVNHPLQI